MNKTLSIFISFLFLSNLIIGQRSINIVNEDNQSLKYPWAGGLNSVQFGEIDINLDGKKDIIALDRDGVFNVISDEYEGNRLYCFINYGQPNEINYQFAPEFNKYFPKLYNWAVFADYNMDGKTDIFTYSPGWAGIKVFKNVSDTELRFETVVSPFLTSFQGGGYTNIFVTYADYPGISDIDNDGDLDILAFGALGTFVDLHKNLSMEKYGLPDSLIFEKTETCWGYFAESDESNDVYLDTCNFFSKNNEIKERHTGSTFLILDLNEDNVSDLLMSDIDYPGLYALYNGGTTEEARITSFDTLFPNQQDVIELFSMPVAAYIDINNDGVKDLLVSPFDPSILKSENKNSVYAYLNHGKTNNPDFQLFTKSFLQSQMLDFGSAPNICIQDIDGDNLNDLIFGSYGYYKSSWYDEAKFLHSEYVSKIDFYKNTGSSISPEFKLINNDLAYLSELNKKGLAPSFFDIDGDGDMDLVCGEENGQLILSKNNQNIFTLTDTNYLNIDVGEYSYPQFFDLNKDGLQDLIIGEKNGNINYYENTGTSQLPKFDFVTDSLGKVNVTNYQLSYYGYSSPNFFRLSDNKTELVCGSEQGEIYYFTDIDNNLDGKFTASNELDILLDTSGISFDRGLRTSAAISDLNNDGKPEMIVGNYAGGLEYFGQSPDVLPGWNDIIAEENIRITPNPASEKISFKLKSSEQFYYSIYDISGKKVKEGKIDNGSIYNEIDIGKLNKGIYLINLRQGSRNQYGKFIKSH